MRITNRLFCFISIALIVTVFAATFARAQVLPPVGYYDSATNQTSTALEVALHNAIQAHTIIPYSANSLDTHDALTVLDRDPANPGNVLEIYSGTSVDTNTWPNWNREHMYPESFGTDSGTQHSDLFNLRACDQSVNSTRGNKYYDISTGSITFPPGAPGSSYDGDSWEPRDADKGFVARGCFYMSVCYDGTGGSENLQLADSPNAGGMIFAKLSTLLAWNRRFPPTSSERTRNSIIDQTYQHNRNPFIDNPDFADMLFLGVDGFTAWENDRFSIAELSNSTITATTASPAGDGLPNLAKYALGYDPHTSYSATILSLTNQTVGGTNYVYFTHNRNHYLSGVTLTYQTSTNLPIWAEAPAEQIIVSQVDTQKDLVTVRLPASSPSQFLRLHMHRLADGSAILDTLPASGLASAGYFGGPFGPTNQTFSLSNSGGVTLNWAASKTANWIDISPAGGALDPGSNVTVTVSINTNANSLAIGLYSDTLSFSNTTSGAGNTTRPIALTVNDPAPNLAVNPASGYTITGNDGGPFNPGSQVYTLSNTGTSPLNWTAGNSSAWLTLSASSGSLAGGSSMDVTASVNAAANTLTTNTYTDTILFTNITNDNGDTSRAVSLTVNNVTPVIVASGSAVVLESCNPTNGVLDPGETVTVNFSIANVGNGNASNLVATLLESGGVTSPSDPQFYGLLAPGGGSVTQGFAFLVGGSCGGNLTATLQLQDGPTDLGTVTYNFPLGHVATTQNENFDEVTTPSLPTNWTTSASGAQSNWVTSIATADSAPNGASSSDTGGVGINELDMPPFPVTSPSAQLIFRQNYSLVASTTNSNLGYDGGVLEIKIGAGSFQDILTAGGSFASGGYNRALSGSFANPLAGQQAWSGVSGGFVTTTVNLPVAAAGQTVQLRWRCATGNPPPSTFGSSGTVAFWGFDASSATADLVAAGISASAVTLTNATGALTYFAGNPGTGKAIAGTGFTGPAGPPASNYSNFGFSLTVTNGSQLGLSGIGFDDQKSATGPTNFAVQASQQMNFSSVIYDSGIQNSHNLSFGANSFELTNSNLTGTVYFRLYAFKTGGSGGTWRIDNLNVQGTVTAPAILGGNGWYIDSISVNDVVCCGP